MALAPSATSFLIWDFFFAFSSSFLLTVTQTAKEKLQRLEKELWSFGTERRVFPRGSGWGKDGDTEREWGAAAELSP